MLRSTWLSEFSTECKARLIAVALVLLTNGAVGIEYIFRPVTPFSRWMGCLGVFLSAWLLLWKDDRADPRMRCTTNCVIIFYGWSLYLLPVDQWPVPPLIASVWWVDPLVLVCMGCSYGLMDSPRYIAQRWSSQKLAH